MTDKKGITILGLGPGNPEQMTYAVKNWIEQTDEIYLRTVHHPCVESFIHDGKKIKSFDDLYDHEDTFENVYEKIVNTILDLGQRPQGVTYAVPGHPYVAETTGPKIVKLAKEKGIPVKVLDGLSFLEPVFSALEMDPYPNLVLVDALELGQLHHPSFPPSYPALICQIYNHPVASNVKLTLMDVYPDDYPVVLVHAAGMENQVVEEVPLYEIDRSKHIGLLTALYVPPMPKEKSFEYFQEIVARLRAPDGCPWDRDQTHASLRSNLLEETYETLSALDSESIAGMTEEFGDLLMQIGLHAQIANEEGEFRMADVIEGITTKLVRRHPHVFANQNVEDVTKVLANWEKIKENERKKKSTGKVKGILDGVPIDMPSLAQAQAYQERAGRVGFDWPTIDGVLEKFNEELAEVKNAQDDEERAKELGDLFFSVVNLARWYKVDAESCLRGTNNKFLNRFRYIEQKATEAGKSLSQMKIEEMDVWWEEAKKQEIG